VDVSEAEALPAGLHGVACPIYTGHNRTTRLFEPLRFLWNATRGSRLTPWRSEYVRWRMETYSGQWAEKMKVGDMLAFVWTSRWELLRFLAWTGRVEREARKRS
jgi:hypothetical protein